MTDQELNELGDGRSLERWVRFAHLESSKDVSLRAVV